MKLSLSVASVLHVLFVAGQVLNIASGYVPAHYQFIVAGVLAIGQAVVGILQHFSPAPGKK